MLSGLMFCYLTVRLTELLLLMGEIFLSHTTPYVTLSMALSWSSAIWFNAVFQLH